MNSLFDVLEYDQTIIGAPKAPTLSGDLTPLPRPVQVGDRMVDREGNVYTCQSVIGRDWHGTGYTLCEFAFSRDGRIVMDGGYAERFTFAPLNTQQTGRLEDVPNSGEGYLGRPAGQGSTWMQWLRNSGLPMDTERAGEPWDAYVSGMTGGQYRKKREARNASH